MSEVLKSQSLKRFARREFHAARGSQEVAGGVCFQTSENAVPRELTLHFASGLRATAQRTCPGFWVHLDENNAPSKVCVWTKAMLPARHRGILSSYKNQCPNLINEAVPFPTWPPPLEKQPQRDKHLHTQKRLQDALICMWGPRVLGTKHLQGVRESGSTQTTASAFQNGTVMTEEPLHPLRCAATPLPSVVG